MTSAPFAPTAKTTHNSGGARERHEQDRQARAAASQQEAAHDAGLVRRFNAGDEAAFEEIMNRYREKIFSVALALLRNRADAEEIAQDTFIRAHRGLARFRGDSSLATWLHRIAVNLARNRYWYFFRRRRHATLSLDCALSDDSDATRGRIAPQIAREGILSLARDHHVVAVESEDSRSVQNDRFDSNGGDVEKNTVCGDETGRRGEGSSVAEGDVDFWSRHGYQKSNQNRYLL